MHKLTADDISVIGVIMMYSQCERVFLEGGPFYHLYTKHIEDDLLFRTEEELDQALNIIAVAVFFAGCKVLAFAVMNNHMHFILEGPEQECRAFYSFIQKKLGFILSKCGRGLLAQLSAPSLVHINSLKQLRDEIVYVIRNPFVDRVNVNMHAYKWCSGYLYFNPFLDQMFVKGISASNLPVKKRREFKHERNPDLDPRIMVLNGVALPSCFVDYHRAEMFFENARQFFQWLYKNVESQLEVARRIGETIALDDIDVWTISRRLSRELGGSDKPKELPNEVKGQLIKKLKYDYSASNAQIARCVGLPVATINSLFPLSAKTK